MEVFEFLLKQAELFGLAVEQNSNRPTGYCPSRKKIYLENFPADMLVCVFAHELGHHMDLGSMSKLRKRHNDLALMLYLKFNLTEYKSQVVRREVVAWNNGRVLLALAGFKNWKVFNITRRAGLSSYIESNHGALQDVTKTLQDAGRSVPLQQATTV